MVKIICERFLTKKTYKMIKASNDREQLIVLKNRFSDILGGRIHGIVSGAMRTLSWHSLVFLRKEFGEFVFGLMYIAYGWLFVKIYVFVLKVFVFFSTLEIRDMVLYGKSVDVGAICSSSLLNLHVKLFVVASLIHFIAIKRRNKKEKRWYSMCMGKSHLMNLPYVKRLGLNEVFVWMYLEPFIVFTIGFILYTLWIDWVYGLFLMLSGFSLFYREQHNYNHHRNKVVEMWDGEIMANQFLAAIKGQKIENTQGYTVYGAASSEILDSFGIIANELGKGLSGKNGIAKQKKPNGQQVSTPVTESNNNRMTFELNPRNEAIALQIKRQNITRREKEEV